MPKWSFKAASLPLIGVGDVTALVNSTYMALYAQSATARYDVSEIYMGGQNTSSAPLYMILARDALVGGSTAVSTGAGAHGVNQALLDQQGTATVSCAVFTSSTTAPTRTTGGGLLSLTFNGFGGIVRWVAPPGSEIKQMGQGVSTGELSLSGFTGTAADGKMGAHIVYEAY